MYGLYHFIVAIIHCLCFAFVKTTVVDPEGVGCVCVVGGCSNPALSPNYFIFMGYFKKKKKKKKEKKGQIDQIETPWQM